MQRAWYCARVVEVQTDEFAFKESGDVSRGVVAHLVSGIPAVSHGRRHAERVAELDKVFDALDVLYGDRHAALFGLIHDFSETRYAKHVWRVFVHSDDRMRDHDPYTVLGAGVQAADELVGRGIALFAFVPDPVHPLERGVYRLIFQPAFLSERGQ